MRIFIAIPVPDQVKIHLSGIQNNISDAKLTLVKDFHLTLKFLGEISESEVERIKTALDTIHCKPFDIELSSIGFFPSENYIRVVWVGLEPHERVIELQRQIDTILAGLGYKREKRFHPHITLARVKVITDKERFLGSIRSMSVEKLKINVKSFSLIKSTLTPEGPVYETIKTFINRH